MRKILTFYFLFILFSSCGIEKTLVYKPKNKKNNDELFQKDSIICNIFLPHYIEAIGLTEFALQFKNNGNNKNIIDKIRVDVLKENRTKTITNIQTLNFLRVTNKRNNFSPSSFEKFDLIPDSLKIISGSNKILNFGYSFLDTLPKNISKKSRVNKYLLIKMKIDVIELKTNKKFQFEKEIRLKQKSEYSFWVLRNC